MVLDEGKYTIRKGSPKTVALVLLDVVFLTFLYRVSTGVKTQHINSLVQASIYYILRGMTRCMQTSVHKNYTRVASSTMHTDTLVGETARTFVCHRGSKVAHERETQRNPSTSNRSCQFASYGSNAWNRSISMILGRRSAMLPAFEKRGTGVKES